MERAISCLSVMSVKNIQLKGDLAAVSLTTVSVRKWCGVKIGVPISLLYQDTGQPSLLRLSVLVLGILALTDIQLCLYTTQNHMASNYSVLEIAELCNDNVDSTTSGVFVPQKHSLPLP